MCVIVYRYDTEWLGMPWDVILLGSLSLLHRHQLWHYDREISEKGCSLKELVQKDLLYSHEKRSTIKEYVTTTNMYVCKINDTYVNLYALFGRSPYPQENMFKLLTNLAPSCIRISSLGEQKLN